MLPSLYHAHHNRNLEDLPFWLSLAEKWGSPVLELGCGTGRVLLPLAAAGHRAVGLDHDLGMLRYLQSLLTPGVKPAPGLVCADISRYQLALKFPLVILPCNTLSTLNVKQRRACLECTRRHLVGGGIFAASLPNPAMLEDLPARSAGELEEELIHPQTLNPVQVSSSWRRTRRKFTISWTYDHLLPDGRVERLVLEAAHQLTSLEAYIKEFEAAGLDVINVNGDYEGSPYSASSPHLVILAALREY